MVANFKKYFDGKNLGKTLMKFLVNTRDRLLDSSDDLASANVEGTLKTFIPDFIPFSVNIRAGICLLLDFVSRQLTWLLKDFFHNVVDNKLTA